MNNFSALVIKPLRMLYQQLPLLYNRGRAFQLPLLRCGSTAQGQRHVDSSQAMSAFIDQNHHLKANTRKLWFQVWLKAMAELTNVSAPLSKKITSLGLQKVKRAS